MRSPDERRKADLAWYHAHKDEISVRRKVAREANPQKHKARHTTYRRLNRDKARESVRWATIKKKYGLTREQYEALLASQHGLCALCKTQPDKLVVDHNHTTGQVRAFLCDFCNKGLGFFLEDKARLHAAIDYLERF